MVRVVPEAGEGVGRTARRRVGRRRRRAPNARPPRAGAVSDEPERLLERIDLVRPMVKVVARL